MKELGNLAIVCAKRKDVLLEILDRHVTVYVGQGPSRASMSAFWSDDDRIVEIIRELNFGSYAEMKINRAA